MAPDLAIEIRSEEETEASWAEKLADHASIQVPEVWRVFLEIDSVEVLVLNAGRYERIKHHDEAPDASLATASRSSPPGRVDLSVNGRGPVDLERDHRGVLRLIFLETKGRPTYIVRDDRPPGESRRRRARPFRSRVGPTQPPLEISPHD